MADITLDVWLYGVLKRYGGDAQKAGHANVKPCLPKGSTVADLLAWLKMPTVERGITFINGQLSAMPGLQPDLGHILSDQDRVAFFDPVSMWPFQYRHGAAMIPEMARAMSAERNGGLHHAYDNEDSHK